MSSQSTTLSPRGAALASGPSLRGKFSTILSNFYNPDTNPNGLINMGVAENYAMLPAISEYTNQHFAITPRHFSYGTGPWGTERMRQGMAKVMNQYFKPVEEVKELDLLISGGCTNMCELLGFTIAEPGDGVLLGRPIYQAFEMDFGTRAGVKCVYASFDDVDQFSPKAAECYEEALLEAQEKGTKIRALLVCNPHNPLGQCYSKDTLIALMKLCTKYKIHFISDEIYALSVYDVPNEPQAEPFTSVLSFETKDYIPQEYLHVLYGMSKDFAAGGLRIGCLYTHNDEIWRAISAMSQFVSSGNFSDEIAANILNSGDWLEDFIKTSQQRLGDSAQLAKSLLQEKGIDFHRGANAGFFLWINLRQFLAGTGKGGWEAEQVLGEKMVEKGVFLTSGESMKAEEAGWFRLVFSHGEDEVREGLKRVFDAVGA